MIDLSHTSMQEHPLHNRLRALHLTDAVQRAVVRADRHRPPDTRKIPNAPAPRLDAYLKRLERIFLNPDEKKRHRNIEALRARIHAALVIEPEAVPEEYFDLHRRIAREQGRAEFTITPEDRAKMIVTVIDDQRQSLDGWIDYLASDDAMYPTWYKFFVFQQVTKLSQFDKERATFKTRTSTTTAPFPAIYREPLAQICDLYERARSGAVLAPDERALNSRSFASAYGYFVQQALAAQLDRSDTIKGEWRLFQRGNMQHARVLFESLQGKGTGWCTAGESDGPHTIGDRRLLRLLLLRPEWQSDPAAPCHPYERRRDR